MERSFDGSTWEETQTNTLNLRGQVEGYTLERTSANMQDVAVSRILDVYGRVTYAGYDSQMDGSINRAEKYYYDANGLLIKKEVDGDGGDTFEVSYTEYYSYDAQNNLIAKGIDWDGDGQVDTLEKYVLDSLGRVIETHQFKDGNDKAEDGVSERQADAIIYNIIDSVTGYVMERREDLDGQGSSNTDSIDKTTVYVRDIDGRNLQESQFLDGDTSNNDGKADKIAYNQYNDAGYRIGQSEDNNGDGEIDRIRSFDITAGGHIISINDYNDGDTENDNGKIDRIEDRFLDDRGWYASIDYYSTTENNERGSLNSAYEYVEFNGKALSGGSTNWSRVENDTNGDGKVDTITLRTAFAADNQPTRQEVYYNVQDTETEFSDAEGLVKRTPDVILVQQYDKYGNAIVEMRDESGDGTYNSVLLREFDKYGRVTEQRQYLNAGTNPLIKDGKVYSQDTATAIEINPSSIWVVTERDIYGTVLERKNIIDNEADGTADKVIIQKYAQDENGVALAPQSSSGVGAASDYLIQQLTFNSATELDADGNIRVADQTVTWNRTEEGKVLERYSDDGSDGIYENVQINRYNDEGKQTLHRLYQANSNYSYTLPEGVKLGTDDNADKLVKEDGSLITPRLTYIYSDTLVSSSGDALVEIEYHDTNYNGYVENVTIRNYDTENRYVYALIDAPNSSGRSETTEQATGDKISHITFQAVNQTLDLTEWADNAEMIQKFAATGLRELRLDNTATTNIELVLSKEILAQIAKTNVQITQADTGDTLKLSGYTESDKTVAGDGRQMFKFTSDLSSSEYTLYVDKDVEISYI